MFTGLITDLGKIISIENNKNKDLLFEIWTSYDVSFIKEGASIACSGVCLTVVDKGSKSFFVEVSDETLSKSTLKSWTVGHIINLERSLSFGNEMGGHIVTGHVDTLAFLKSSKASKGSTILTFSLTDKFLPMICPKGSITVDGVSLTVNDVSHKENQVEFNVNIVPHTFKKTTFGFLEIGKNVNIEVDILARYVANSSKFTRKIA